MGFEKIGDDGIRRSGGLAFNLLPVAGPHKEGLGTYGSSQLNIAGFVTNHYTLGGIKPVVLSGLLDHPRGGFAATACVVWMVRAEKDSVHADALLGEELQEPRMYLLESCFVEEPASDGGLVGGDDQSKTALPHSTHAQSCVRKENHTLGI